MSKIREKEQRGFTLIEVIVATMIIVVAAIPLLSAFVASSRMNLKGRQKEQAMTIAENTIESIKALGATTTLDWVNNGSSSSVAVISNSSLATKTATPEIIGAPIKGSMEVTLSDGTSKVNVIDYLEFNFTVDNIYMGKTYYDAYVTIKLDTSDDVNVLAYSNADKYSAAGMNILKYYYVYVYVFADGVITQGQVPDTSKSLAKYSGSFVSQS